MLLAHNLVSTLVAHTNCTVLLLLTQVATLVVCNEIEINGLYR